MRSMRHLGPIVLIALTGCSSILGIEQLSGVDGGSNGSGSDGSRPPADIPPTPDQITITGRLAADAGVSAGNLTIELHRINGQLITSTQTAVDGSFGMLVTTGNQPVDGYLETANGDPTMMQRTRFYFSKPLTSDADGSFPVFTSQDLQMLAAVAASSYDNFSDVLLMIVIDDSDKPVSGAVINLMGSGDLRYADDSGNPRPGLPSTQMQGMAWAFKVDPSPRTITAVSATPGVTFKSPVLDLAPSMVSIFSVRQQ